MKCWLSGLAGIHKMLVRIAGRKDPDQTSLQKQPDLGMLCFSRSCLGSQLVFEIL